MTKFVWIRDKKELRALHKVWPPSGDYSNPGMGLYEKYRITEENMVDVANWCHETGCGRRMSFDTFKFKRKEDITAFLLRWS